MSKTQEILTKYKNLTISSGNNSYSFPAFLEDSDITYDLKEQPLPFAPVSFTNDSMALRVLEKVKFTFNIFSHNEKECIENWDKFKHLRNIIKPRYVLVNEQLVPKIENVTGFIKIIFNGMPHNRSSIDVHLISFSYLINKDLGFLEKNKNLIPIGFKISLEGKVLLPLSETISISRIPSKENTTNGTGSDQQMLAYLDTMIKAYEGQLFTNGGGYINSSNEKFSADFDKITNDPELLDTFTAYTEAVQQINYLKRAKK